MHYCYLKLYAVNMKFQRSQRPPEHTQTPKFSREEPLNRHPSPLQSDFRPPVGDLPGSAPCCTYIIDLFAISLKRWHNWQ